MIPPNLNRTQEEQAHGIIANIDTLMRELCKVTKAEFLVYHIEYKLSNKDREHIVSRGFIQEQHDPMTVGQHNSVMIKHLEEKRKEELGF